MWQNNPFLNKNHSMISITYKQILENFQVYVYGGVPNFGNVVHQNY